MSWISVVLVIGAVQGVFLALLLLGTPKGNRTANPWLAGFVGAFALLAVRDAAVESGLVLRYLHAALLFDWLLLLIGPLMLFYARALTGEPVRIRTFVPHALPALALAIWILPYHLLPEAEMRRVAEHEVASDGEASVLVILSVLQTFAYWLWAVLLLRRHAMRMKMNYSDIAQRSFNWLSMLLRLNLVLWLLWVLALTTNAEIARMMSNLAFPLGAYLAGFWGLRQAQVFFEPLPEKDTDTDSGSAKYAKSRLTPERARDIAAELDRVMMQFKPYLQNDLTLTELARRVDVSGHHLSQVFSESIGTSFFDYINTQRVEEVKRRLSDSRETETSILDIAFSAGFNSKAAFNAAFRKHVGTTPSAFRRAAQPAPL